MALGDSISAGFAMIGQIPENIVEWRHYVFSIGGASDAFTLLNNIKKYNPAVQGEATTWTLPLTKGGQLDGAVSHASVQNVPEQVDYLVNQLKTTYASKVNFQDDWKLLTLFIGANNLCGSCQFRPETLPQYFEEHLRLVLTQIKDKIPRTFVNLVTIFNISGVYYAGKDYWYCEVIWKYIAKKECSCMQTGKKADLDIMDLRATQFNAISNKLAIEFAALNSPNFTVSVQPGLTGIQVQKFGEAYLSNLDCFHPSLCANQAFTYMIWNNMFEPIGKKTSNIDTNNLKIHCPVAGEYIQ
jgi:small subunit ribosomal protein S29e/phospholipase B1